MALASTGAISADDIRTEYGVTGAIDFGSMYRGGSNIRAKAANNTGANLASTVPTSGTITFDNFRGTAKGFRFTFSSGATDQSAATLFGTDYGVDYPKEIVINSGVELGATTTSEEALEVPTGLSGGLTITNNGTLSGAGGAAGADGGDAFEAAVACTLVNNGTIRAGGGGGGNGGNGTLTAQEPSVSGNDHSIVSGNYYNLRLRVRYGNTNSTGYFYAYMNSANSNGQGAAGSLVALGFFFKASIGSSGQTSLGGLTFSGFSTNAFNYNSGVNNIPGGSANFNGNQFRATNNNPTWPNGNGYCYISGTATQSFTFKLGYRGYVTSTGNYYWNGGYLSQGGSGGSSSGGAGGVGAGYNQSVGAGATGGSNAGSGGNGGAFGSSGSTGANGNSTNGSAGGAAGKYIRGTSFVTLTQNGTVLGGTA